MECNTYVVTEMKLFKQRNVYRVTINNYTFLMRVHGHKQKSFVRHNNKTSENLLKVVYIRVNIVLTHIDL